MRYGRDELISTYLAATAYFGDGFGDYVDHLEYNTALQQFYKERLIALEQLFDVEFDRKRSQVRGRSIEARALAGLFVNTAESCLRARTPWSGYLEAGLLIRALSAGGPAGHDYLEATTRIGELRDESRQLHREALDALARVLLGEKAEAVFDSADLLAVGFDDSTAPRTSDYPGSEDG